jgi:hypothetical protein
MDQTAEQERNELRTIDIQGETAAFAQRVADDLQAEVETHRQQLANVTRLVSHWQSVADQLLSENAHMRANLAAKDQEAVVAHHTIRRIQKENTSLKAVIAHQTAR